MIRPREHWNDGGAIKGAIARALYAATRIATPIAVAASLLALTAMAVVDDMLGARWSLGLFYYLPIGFAAWRLGRSFGLLAGLLGAAAWYTSTVGFSGDPATSAVSLWGFLSRVVSFGIVALVVAEMRELFERERGLARHDSLTGALLGRAFRDVLDHEVALARREGRSLALLYADMDDFKQVNEQVGHAGGDEALCAFARGARNATSGRDHLARTGGDEFVVLLIGRDGRERDSIEEVRRSIVAALADGPVPVTCTIGAVMVPVGREIEAGELVRRADNAMFMAKRAGKGGLCIFEVGGRHPLSVAA